MNIRPLLLISLIFATSASAEVWDKLAQAAKTAYTANFKGEYVRQTKNGIETFNIYRQRDKQTLNERRIATNGKPYEIIRNRNQVAFYATDAQGLKRAGTDESNRFPAILPWHISQLGENYEATAQGNGRIAGRTCHIVRLTPYDGNRYIQELCLDDVDNLPLSRTYIHNNTVVRADLFSAIDRENIASTAELTPSSALPVKLVRKFDENAIQATFDDDLITIVPQGYAIVGKKRTQNRFHYLFTDGLTYIILFIDPVDEYSDTANMLPTDSILSSVSINIDQRRLTAIGDLPKDGLNQWLNNISLNYQE